MHRFELATDVLVLTLFFGLYAHAFVTRPRHVVTNWRGKADGLRMEEASEKAA